MMTLESIYVEGIPHVTFKAFNYSKENSFGKINQRYEKLFVPVSTIQTHTYL